MEVMCATCEAKKKVLEDGEFAFFTCFECNTTWRLGHVWEIVK